MFVVVLDDDVVLVVGLVVAEVQWWVVGVELGGEGVVVAHGLYEIVDIYKYYVVVVEILG